MNQRNACCWIVCGLLFGGMLMSTRAADSFQMDEPVILYEIFVRDFGENGTFADVEQKLDELDDLGVNMLWLMPIYPLGQEKKKGPVGSPYAIQDYRKIESMLGSKEDLVRLVKAAHQRGLKVILDFVPNHCSWDSIYIREHPELLAKDENGKPRAVNPVWNDIVQFDHSNPDTQSELLSVMHYLMTAYGVDGFRVDVAGMLPNEFYQRAIPEMRQDYTNVFMLAEAFGDRYHHLGFDSSYDSIFRDRMWEVSQGSKPARALTEHMEFVIQNFPDGAQLMRYTENHDIDRTTHVFTNGLDRVFAALVFTAPGIPMIYAGQEVGLSKRPDIFSQEPLQWENGDTELKEYYKKLIKLRKTSPPLSQGRYNTLMNSHGEQVVSFLREENGAGVVVILNVLDKALTNVIVALPEDAQKLGVVTELTTGIELPSKVTENQELILNLPPYSAVVESFVN